MSTYTGTLMCVCSGCGERTEAEPDDALMYQQSMTTAAPELKFKELIGNAAYDVVNPNSDKTCPKCSRERVKYIRIGEEMRIIYTCKCGYNWS